MASGIRLKRTPASVTAGLTRIRGSFDLGPRAWRTRNFRFRDQRGRKNSMLLFVCVCVCVCVCFYAQTTWTVRPGRWDQRGCACNLVTTDNSILYTPLPSDRVLTVDGKLLITVQNNPYSNTAGLSTTNWTSWSVNHKLHTQSCMLFPCYVTVWICERNKYIYHAFFSRISFHSAAAEQNVTIKNKKVLFEKIRFVQ